MLSNYIYCQYAINDNERDWERLGNVGRLLSKNSVLPSVISLFFMPCIFQSVCPCPYYMAAPMSMHLSCIYPCVFVAVLHCIIY